MFFINKLGSKNRVVNFFYFRNFYSYMENINPLSSKYETYATPNTIQTRKALSLSDLNRQSVTKSKIPIKKLFQSYYFVYYII